MALDEVEKNMAIQSELLRKNKGKLNTNIKVSFASL